MSRVADIDRYLRAYFASQGAPAAPPSDFEIRPFVTISRQAGVGGHELADVMVSVFTDSGDSMLAGWRVYDKTLCEMVAQDPRYRSSLESLVDEEYRSKAGDFFHQMIRSTVDQKLVMDKAFLAVRTVAGMGKSIILGRAGSHVTRDMAHGVAVRVAGPEEWRVERAMTTHDLTEREARAKGRRRDADRARLLRAHFGADIDDPLGYDAVFNAASVPFEEIARCTAVMVMAKSSIRPAGDGG